MLQGIHRDHTCPIDRQSGADGLGGQEAGGTGGWGPQSVTQKPQPLSCVDPVPVPVEPAAVAAPVLYSTGSVAGSGRYPCACLSAREALKGILMAVPQNLRSAGHPLCALLRSSLLPLRLSGRKLPHPSKSPTSSSPPRSDPASDPASAHRYRAPTASSVCSTPSSRTPSSTASCCAMASVMAS